MKDVKHAFNWASDWAATLSKTQSIISLLFSAARTRRSTLAWDRTILRMISFSFLESRTSRPSSSPSGESSYSSLRTMEDGVEVNDAWAPHEGGGEHADVVEGTEDDIRPKSPPTVDSNDDKRADVRRAKASSLMTSCPTQLIHGSPVSTPPCFKLLARRCTRRSSLVRRSPTTPAAAAAAS